MSEWKANLKGKANQVDWHLKESKDCKYALDLMAREYLYKVHGIMIGVTKVGITTVMSFNLDTSGETPVIELFGEQDFPDQYYDYATETISLRKIVVD